MSTWTVRIETRTSGLRVAVKDLIDLVGHPTVAGSAALDDATPVDADGACLAGIRAAEAEGRARIVGKTSMHELAYGISGVNAWWGTPVNPLDPRLVPGGSSSGSAVAVATGEADVALGSDTGGSIRIPAACCGVAGLKTTWGRIPVAGSRPLTPELDTIGPLAADVAGVVAGMALLEPGFAPAPEAPRRVIRARVTADPTIDGAIDAALAAAGFPTTSEPRLDAALDPALLAAGVVLDAGAWATNAGLVADRGDRIGGDVAARLAKASTVTAGELEAARREGVAWRSLLDELWTTADLIALPTLTGPPPALADAADMFKVRGWTLSFNLSGNPAISLPVGGPGPVPASLQLVAPHGGEEVLVAAGALIEEAVR